MPEDFYAANYARKTIEGADFADVQTLMCWDYVLHCAQKAGLIDVGKVNIPMSEPEAKRVLVSTSDARVRSARAVKEISAGQALGFFHTGTLVHAAVSLGHGMAAGTKNGCIGLGRAMGLDRIDLMKLTWDDQGRIVQGTYRVLTLHRRSLSYLRFL